MSVPFLELFQGALEFNGGYFHSVEAEDLGEPSGGYGLSLWVNAKRPAKSPSVLLSRGSQTVHQPELSLHERSLFVKFNTERMGVQSLCSNLELPLKQWVHIAFTIVHDGVTEASLYLNGRLDSQITVRDPPIYSDQKIYVGKDPWNQGFTGTIAEPLHFKSPLLHTDIEEMYSSGAENWSKNHTFNSTGVLLAKTQASTGMPKSMQSPRLLQTDPPAQTARAMADFSRHEALVNYFTAKPKMYNRAALLVSNFDWLFTFYRVLRCTLPSYRDETNSVLNLLEIDRMMPALYELQLRFTKTEIIEFAKVLRAHRPVDYGASMPSWCDLDRDDLIDFFILLDSLKSFIELGEVTDDLDAEEKYGHLYTAAEDFLATKETNFELCIDFCVRCAEHQTTTWHDENEYAHWFNDAFKELTEEFSAAEFTGNKYGPPSIGTFALLAEGIGPQRMQDRWGRTCLFKVKNARPTVRALIDSVYLAAFELGSFIEVASRQADYRAEHHHKRHPDSQSDPIPLKASPSRPRTTRPDTEYEPDQLMVCRNWGCMVKTYEYGKNHKKACRYHPGRWEFGSIHSLWPEHWTCCRGEWTAPGCRRGFHRGVVAVKVPRRCINRGAINPKKYQPDSFCGKCFPDPSTCDKKYVADPAECKYHAGYKVPTDVGTFLWNCCNQEVDPQEIDETYCVEGRHRFAEYPDEEAKLYFVTKVDDNPVLGLKKILPNNFKESGRNCRFYNPEIKPYVNPFERKKERQILEHEPRQCLNWACEKIYKEADNSPTACRCHTGYWDFGHSGILKGSETIVLWEPHWRCCGGKWEDEGCTLKRHNGPLASKAPQHKWKWPHEGAQRRFIKKVSKLWQEKLQAENVTKAQIIKKYNLVCKEKGSKMLPVSALYRFCQELHLHILCVSDDMSYMFKYQDLVSRKAEKILAGNTGYVTKETFIDWWFAPLEVIRPEMASE